MQASRSDPDEFLLCPNYVVSLVIVSYLLFLEGTKGYGNILYFGGNFVDSSDHHLKRRLPMPAQGLLLDSLWQLRGYPSGITLTKQSIFVCVHVYNFK